MSFVEQAAKIFGEISEFKFHVCLFGRDAFYIEGARPIKIDGDEMIFKAANALITLCGQNLGVKELSCDSAAVIGRVTSFSVREL